MMALFRNITSWGITASTPVEEAHHIRLSNAVMIFMVLTSAVETMACFLAGANQAALINMTAPFVFGGGLLLMRAGRTILARMLMLTITYMAMYGMATILGPDSGAYLVLLSCSAVSFIFFSLEQWKHLLFGLLAPVICLAFLEMTHYEPVFGLARAPLNSSQLLVIRLATVLTLWLVLIGHFVHSIRHRRQSQKTLVESAKMVALGQMAAGIAHEVNNPLTRIVGHAERLKTLTAEGALSSGQVNAIADQILNTGMRIGAIVHGLQAISRDASDDPFVELPLHSLVRLSLDYCRARFDSGQVKLTVTPIPAHWTVIGREAQLSEVFLNVLNNAFDAVVSRRERWIHIEVLAKSEMIEVAITDSGPGISSSDSDKIFDPFFTTKPVGKGTGLGLSISRAIMIAHQGEIVCDPTSSNTRFVIRIPRGRDVAAHPENTQPSVEAGPQV